MISNKPRQVVLVGHCIPDSAYLKMAIAAADPLVQVVGAKDQADLEKRLADGVDLVMFNREIDGGFDFDRGVALIGDLKPRFPGVAMMLISNYPDAQAAAVAAGAVTGFGKREIGHPKTTLTIRAALASARLKQGA